MKISFRRMTAIVLMLLGVSCLCSCNNLLRNLVNRVSVKKTLTDARPVVDTLAKDAGREFSAGLSENMKTISQQVISGLKGVTDTLDPDIQRLFKVIDSVGNLSDSQLVKLGNRLTELIMRVKSEIKDPSIQAFINSVVDDATRRVTKNTRSALSDMVQLTLDSLNTPSSNRKIALLIATLLNDSTKAQTQRLLSAVLQPVIDSVASKVHTVVHQELPFFQKWAAELLWGLGILAVGIIGYVWYQRRKYARLLQILTYQIDKIPSRDIYDELTTNIQASTQKENLEPLLRNTLKKQGLNPG